MAQSRPLPRQELGVRGVVAAEGSSPNLTDFVKLKTIGTGTFGKVLLVQHRQSRKYFAMKVLEKAKVVSLRQCYHVVYEKEILMAISCTFVVKMYHTFKDNCNLFMLMEYVQGGEMFHHLRNVGRFGESHSKFYAGQVVLAFEYLHRSNIIYRDLKPENIMIDHTGYIKLTDFGFAKRVRNYTWTMCGTPDYMAPEIILSKGYTKAVDWWALGILIYEMVSGYPPFYSDKPCRTYEKIVAGQIRYPGHFTPDLRHLLCNLLQANVDKRFGVLKNGAQDVKQHSWFATIDWGALAHKRIYAPFVPRVRNPEDISNFDNYDEESLAVSAIERYPREFSDF